jgi:regulator of RNase E activity RraA
MSTPLINQLGRRQARHHPAPTPPPSTGSPSFGVATIHEAMGRVGLMKPYMRPVYAGAHMCGTAVTVLLQPGDNWMMHVAAEQLQPGDVAVAACTTDNDRRLLRRPAGHLVPARGARGLVIDGGVRDVADLDRDGLPGLQQGHPCQGHDQGHAGLGEHPGGLRRRAGQPGRRGGGR